MRRNLTSQFGFTARVRTSDHTTTRTPTPAEASKHITPTTCRRCWIRTQHIYREGALVLLPAGGAARIFRILLSLFWYLVAYSYVRTCPPDQGTGNFYTWYRKAQGVGWLVPQNSAVPGRAGSRSIATPEGLFEASAL